MSTPALKPSFQDAHVGHWLRVALERFDVRVAQLMAQHPAVALGLSNLLTRDQLGAAHIHITRHLGADGARLTELARRAGISKQAMGALVSTCEAWGMVERGPDPTDARARWVQFTATGLAWLGAYQDAVSQAEDEMRQSIGAEVVTVVAIGLEAYSGQ